MRDALHPVGFPLVLLGAGLFILHPVLVPFAAINPFGAGGSSGTLGWVIATGTPVLLIGPGVCCIRLMKKSSARGGDRSC